MSYRDDILAQEARHAALDGELAAKTQELDAATRLLEAAKARARLPVLDNIRIAKPCRADWNEMSGDDRVRTCATCSKQVFNLSSLTRAQAEALVIEKHGELCGRYYQRKDGTIMLADCTIGGPRSRLTKAVVAGTIAALAGVAIHAHRGHDRHTVLAETVVSPSLEEPAAHVTGAAQERATPPLQLESPVEAVLPLTGALRFTEP